MSIFFELNSKKKLPEKDLGKELGKVIEVTSKEQLDNLTTEDHETKLVVLNFSDEKLFKKMFDGELKVPETNLSDEDIDELLHGFNIWEEKENNGKFIYSLDLVYKFVPEFIKYLQKNVEDDIVLWRTWGYDYDKPVENSISIKDLTANDIFKFIENENLKQARKITITK